MKSLITTDAFNIGKRIRNINSHYFVVYDNKQDKYMIYCDNQGAKKEIISNKHLYYVLTLPYSQLDVRTLKYLVNTDVDNLEKIIAEIDEQNKKVQQDNRLKIKNQALEVAENKLRQLTR